MNSPKKQSRIAAALNFLNGLPAPFALLYVTSVLIVRGEYLNEGHAQQSRNQFVTITRDDQRGEN